MQPQMPRLTRAETGRENGSRLGNKKGTGSMLPVRKEGTLYK